MSFIFIPAIANSELELEDGLGNLQLENGDALVLESSAAVPEGAVSVWDENPVLPIEYRYWHEYLFLQQEPATWHGYLEAWQNLSTQLMPEYSSEYLYGDIHNWPYLVLQQGPSTWHGYEEAWQNQSTQLMPEYTSEYLYGEIHNYPYFFMQLSTPTFLPDGTGVPGPTSTEPDFPSRTTTEPE